MEVIKKVSERRAGAMRQLMAYFPLRRARYKVSALFRSCLV